MSLDPRLTALIERAAEFNAIRPDDVLEIAQHEIDEHESLSLAGAVVCMLDAWRWELHRSITMLTLQGRTARLAELKEREDCVAAMVAEGLEFAAGTCPVPT